MKSVLPKTVEAEAALAVSLATGGVWVTGCWAGELRFGTCVVG